MANRLVDFIDKLLTHKRALTETINDQLKSIGQIEHYSHRSPTNFLVHLLCCLIAYYLKLKKPSFHIDHDA
jgi:Transposase DDE domain